MALTIVPPTTVTDILAAAVNGVPQVGSLTISNPWFVDANGNTHPAGSQIVYVDRNGRFSVQLAPNAGGMPATAYYTVTYNLNGGTTLNDSWIVPAATVSLTIAQVHINKVLPGPEFLIPLSQIGCANGVIGNVPVWNGSSYEPLPPPFGLLPPPAPFSLPIQKVSAVPITASVHGKGGLALAFLFSAENPPLSEGANYSRDGYGNLVLSTSPTFTGNAQIVSGIIQGQSTPYTQTLATPQRTVTILASTHNQGPYALAFCFSNEALPVAVQAAAWNRNGSGDIILTFSPPFQGTIEIIAGGWAGSSVFLMTVNNAASASIPQTLHGKGTQALAFCFNTDAPSKFVTIPYTRNAAGDINFTFSPNFTGLIQIINAQ